MSVFKALYHENFEIPKIFQNDLKCLQSASRTSKVDANSFWGAFWAEQKFSFFTPKPPRNHVSELTKSSKMFKNIFLPK